MVETISVNVIEARVSQRRGGGFTGFLFIHYDSPDVIELSKRIREKETHDTLVMTRISDGAEFVAKNIFFTQEKSHFEPNTRFPKDWHRYEFICDSFTQS